MAERPAAVQAQASRSVLLTALRDPMGAWRSLLPLEQIMLLAMLVAALIVASAGVQLYVPTPMTLRFIFRHYVGAMVFIALVGVAAALWRERHAVGRNLWPKLRLTFAFTVIVYLHFNFKLWSRLINPTLYDETYRRWDAALGGFVPWFESGRDWFQPLLSWSANPYHDLFVAMFLFTFGLAALRGLKAYETTVTATALVLFLGGLAYALAPAIGPFIYEAGSHDGTAVLQARMHAAYGLFIASSGHPHFGSEAFVDATAAMPSLHVANTLVFTLLGIRFAPWSAVVLVPTLAYMSTEAVANNFHYFVDLIAGALLAGLCVAVATWLVERRHRHATGS